MAVGSSCAVKCWLVFESLGHVPPWVVTGFGGAVKDLPPLELRPRFSELPAVGLSCLSCVQDGLAVGPACGSNPDCVKQAALARRPFKVV